MRFVSLILALAIAASAVGAGRMPEVKRTDQHSAVSTKDSSHEKEEEHDCGSASMDVLPDRDRAGEPITTRWTLRPVAVRIVLPRCSP
jgi:hypothetical protein